MANSVITSGYTPQPADAEKSTAVITSGYYEAPKEPVKELEKNEVELKANKK
jgi:hypothetical protein